MFRDEFKARYTTIPFAFYKAHCKGACRDMLSHQHKEIELISIREGGGVFYIGDRAYTAKQGDLLIIPPYALHRVNTAEEVETLYSCICFDLSLLWDRPLAEGLEGGTISTRSLFYADEVDTASLSSWLEKTCVLCEAGAEGWEMQTIGYLSLIFGSLKSKGAFPKRTEEKAEASFAERVVRYIAENLSSPITSSTAAEHLFMNNSYFCRLFKRTFDCCFTDYLLAYRLEHAKISVRGTSLPITEIAFRSGFRSCSYFDQVFKGRFGLSPLAYRKRSLP